MGIKKSILFGLTLLDVVFRELRDPGGFVSFSYENLYGFVPKSYKKNSLYSITHSLKTDENIELLSRGKFQLTVKGKELAIDYFPLLRFSNKPWDGKWRILGFDIEEEKRSLRNIFRKFLHRFGFGMLQKSLYISPLPLEEDIERFLSSKREFLSNAYIFVSDQFLFEAKERFIEKVFNIERINSEYKDLLKGIRDDLTTEERVQAIRKFLEISAKDPFLPRELLPKGFVRDEVWSAVFVKGLFRFQH